MDTIIEIYVVVGLSLAILVGVVAARATLSAISRAKWLQCEFSNGLMDIVERYDDDVETTTLALYLNQSLQQQQTPSAAALAQYSNKMAIKPSAEQMANIVARLIAAAHYAERIAESLAFDEIDDEAARSHLASLTENIENIRRDASSIPGKEVAPCEM